MRIPMHNVHVVYSIPLVEANTGIYNSTSLYFLYLVSHNNASYWGSGVGIIQPLYWDNIVGQEWCCRLPTTYNLTMNTWIMSSVVYTYTVRVMDWLIAVVCILGRSTLHRVCGHYATSTNSGLGSVIGRRTFYGSKGLAITQQSSHTHCVSVYVALLPSVLLSWGSCNTNLELS